MKDQFRSDERIGKVTAPLLILHGVHDRIVPYAMGERMFELANKPKHIVRFLDGGHEDLDSQRRARRRRPLPRRRFGLNIAAVRLQNVG